MTIAAEVLVVLLGAVLFVELSAFSLSRAGAGQFSANHWRAFLWIAIVLSAAIAIARSYL